MGAACGGPYPSPWIRATPGGIDAANDATFWNLERGGLRFLSVVALTLGAACGGDLAVAPAAVPSPAERTTGAATTSGAELLVLVDETGAARRVLIVRDERDPRRRQVERMGFRTLTREAVAAGQVDAATRELFNQGAGKELPVTFRRSAHDWTPILTAMVADLATTPQIATRLAFAIDGTTSTRGVRATVDSVMGSLESTLNAALADDARAGCNNSSPEVATNVGVIQADGDPCADERSDANWARGRLIAETIIISAQFALLAENPLLWTLLPWRVQAATLAMAEVNRAYAVSMRELRQCEANR